MVEMAIMTKCDFREKAIKYCERHPGAIFKKWAICLCSDGCHRFLVYYDLKGKEHIDSIKLDSLINY